MERFHVRVDENGEIEIPPAIREILGIQGGDDVMLELREHEIILTPASPGSAISVTVRLEAVSKPPQGDHEAGDVEEGLVDGQLAVITDSQVAEVSQPSICPFNLPTFAVTT